LKQHDPQDLVRWRTQANSPAVENGRCNGVTRTADHSKATASSLISQAAAQLTKLH
jgi:hypothetical protein